MSLACWRRDDFDIAPTRTSPLLSRAMGTKDPRVDAYIAKSAEFAQPILTHLRGLVHKAVPDVEEVIKWGMPYFDYKGPVCHMAAFKGHVAFGFWKQTAMKSPIIAEGANSMGSVGRIASRKDLPSDKEITAALKEAVALNESGVKVTVRSTEPKKAARIHPEFKAALEDSPAAKAQFADFPPGKKRDYVDWIADAKSDATREKRIATAVEWIAEGKARNWKYERK